MSGVSGGQGGISGSGGSAGPSTASLSSNSGFTAGGNAGIGSTTGFNQQTLIILGVVALAAFWLLRR